MRRLLLLAAAPLGLASAAAQDAPILFDDVTLFDGERVREKADVLVRDGEVVRVAGRVRAPDGATVVDGEGLFLMPGMIDAHTHVFSAEGGRDALRFGVTTQLDHFTMASFAEAEAAQRESADRTDRADLYSARTLVTAPGGHGTQFGMDIPTLERAEDADGFVAARLEEGSDWIKIAYEPGREALPSLDRETMAAAVKAAQARGALAVVHVSTRDAARDALAAGADGLVHVFGDEKADAEVVRLAKRSGAFVIPTLAVNAAAAGEEIGADAADDPRLAPALSAAQRGQLGATFGSFRMGDAAVSRQATRAFSEAGVPILAGSDAPNPGTTYGASMHTEMALLVEAGLSETDALRAATSAPADAFQLEDRGRIAKGQRADLVLLEADPTADIENSRAIRAVYKNGYEVDRTVVAVVGEAVAVPEGGVLADFEEGAMTAYGVPMVPTADDIAGGASAARTDVVDGTLRVDGTVSAQFPFPWVGAGAFLSFDGSRSADWSGHETLRFRAEGPARGYTLMLFTATSPQMPATVPFTLAGEGWQDVALDLSAARGADLSQVFGFAITTGRPEGEVAFGLDDLRLE